MEIAFIPGWLLARSGIPQSRQRDADLLLSNLLLLLLLPALARLPHICLMHSLFGLPCPGCGVTHSLLALCRLDWRASWQANPAGLAVAWVVGMQIGGRPLALCLPAWSRTLGPASLYSSRFAIAALITVWMVRLF